MRTVFTFVAKLILKTAIAMVLAMLYILNIVLVFFNATVRYVALLMMFVAAVIAITTYSDHGLTTDVVECIGTFMGAGVFFYVTPQISKLIDLLTDVLSAVFHSIHLTARPSVKYIFD